MNCRLMTGLNHLNWVITCCSAGRPWLTVIIVHLHMKLNRFWWITVGVRRTWCPGLYLLFEPYMQVVRRHSKLTKGPMTSKMTISQRNTLECLFFLYFHFSISFPMWWWTVSVEALMWMSLDTDEWREWQLHSQRKGSLLSHPFCISSLPINSIYIQKPCWHLLLDSLFMLLCFL